LSSPRHPTDRCSSRNACRECRHNGFDWVPLYAPFCVVKQLRSDIAAMFRGTPRCFDTILKRILNIRCSPRSLVRCFVNLFAHLFQHGLRHFALPLWYLSSVLIRLFPGSLLNLADKVLNLARILFSSALIFQAGTSGKLASLLLDCAFDFVKLP
jgi:hypothetical protein